MPNRIKFICLCLILILSAGCVKNHVNLEESGTPDSRTVIVGSIGTGEKGLPVPGEALGKRPSRRGEHFTILRLVRDRPVMSCDVVVVGRKPNFHKPLNAVYEWTGKGFMLGMHVAGGLGQVVGGASPEVGLAVIITPIVAGAACGFAVGVADGIVKTAEQLGKTVTKEERMITCTSYEYDSLDRITRMRMYTADRTQELVRTTFEYEGQGRIPGRTVVKSLIEGTEQEVR